MLVYGECKCFVMQMLYVCVLCASSGFPQSWKILESHGKKAVMESHGKVMETEENK